MHRTVATIMLVAALTAGAPGRNAVAGETIWLKSSVIKEATYDAGARTLRLAFSSGTRYTYQAVPPGLFAGLKRAEHPGAYFHAYIRNRYVGTPAVAAGVGALPRRLNCVATGAQKRVGEGS